ncbi:MAG: 30S ribosomal protein S18 [Patescibacteria group bacterium]
MPVFFRPKPVPRNCYFCNSKTQPDYKEVDLLRKYMSERGKILGKERSGVCTKHQRLVGQAIKQARHMALLPFVAK